MAKVAVPRAATAVIDRAIQVHGGAGITDVTPLAAMYAWHRAMRTLRRTRRGAPAVDRARGAEQCAGASCGDCGGVSFCLVDGLRFRSPPVALLSRRACAVSRAPVPVVDDAAAATG